MPRYSETRVQSAFESYVMLSSPIELSIEGLIVQIQRDYPEIGGFTVLGPSTLNTSGLVSFTMMLADDSEADSVKIIVNSQSRLPQGHYEPTIKNAHFFPEARQAFNAHTHYVTVSVNSKDATLASRFLAARLMTCVSASIASARQCTAIMYPGGDVIASPAGWREGAKLAASGKWPHMIWNSLNFTYVKNHPAPYVTCASIGMAAFNGHEVVFTQAPVSANIAAKCVLSSLEMLLGLGHVFRDSDTFGVEGEQLRLRIRHMKEGRLAQTDTWFLLHPDCPLDEMDIFGPRSLPPAPAGVTNDFRGDEDFMDQILKKNGF